MSYTAASRKNINGRHVARRPKQSLAERLARRRESHIAAEMPRRVKRAIRHANWNRWPFRGFPVLTAEDKACVRTIGVGAFMRNVHEHTRGHRDAVRMQIETTD